MLSCPCSGKWPIPRLIQTSLIKFSESKKQDRKTGGGLGKKVSRNREGANTMYEIIKKIPLVIQKENRV